MDNYREFERYVQSLQNNAFSCLQISKVNDQHAQIYNHTVVVKNYKSCAGSVKSTLRLPEAFCQNGLGTKNEGSKATEWTDDVGKRLIITISRSKFVSLLCTLPPLNCPDLAKSSKWDHSGWYPPTLELLQVCHSALRRWRWWNWLCRD